MSEIDPSLEHATEMGFALGVVLRKTEERAQCIMLQGRSVAEREDEDDEYGWFTSTPTSAIDSDLSVSFTDDYVDILESKLQEPLVMPREGTWTSGGGARVLTKNGLGETWDLIQEGTIFHYHEFEQIQGVGETGNVSFTVTQVAGEYCISPHPLSTLGIIEAIAKAKQAKDDGIRHKITQIQAAIDSLAESVEIADPDSIAIFSGAEVQYNQEGKPYLAVPPKLILSEKYGPVLVEVRSLTVHGLTREYSGKALFAVRNNANGEEELGEYWIPSHFPLEETDENGSPQVTGKTWKSLRITLTQPNQRTTDALEEEKIIMEVNSQLYSATSDKEMLVGNQGFGGVPYEDFVDVNNPDPYYEKDEGMDDLPSYWRAAPMVFAIDDLVSLQEVRLRLPGL